MSAEDAAWTALVASCYRWASNHMDQWETFKFKTQDGMVYVRISLKVEHPDDYGEVDMVGRPVMKTEGKS